MPPFSISPAEWVSDPVLALRDALAATDLPVVEVHLSNVYVREPFRHHSFISGIAVAVISGLGAEGYRMGLRALTSRLQD